MPDTTVYNAAESPHANTSDVPTILIVDDTPTNVDFVQSILAAEGFRTLTAGDGASAVALSRSRRPDLILLDVIMPGETGFETCRRLKSDPLTSDVPVIFLSSLDDVKSKVTGLKMGAVDFVSKPLYGEEVLARVRVHLRIRENSRAIVEKHRVRLEQLRTAQQAILVRPEDEPDASFALYFQPLEEASGDFYDVVPVDAQCFGYFVADVSGHGVSAAFLTSAIKALLRQYAGPLFSPEDTLRGVDAVMRQMLGEEQYLTACYAHLNRRTRKLSVISAGQVRDEIRAMASFRTLNLMADFSSLGPFDIVSCRNVAIYFNERDRAMLFDRMAGSLERNGCLIIGAMESLGASSPRREARRHLRSVYYARKESGTG